MRTAVPLISTSMADLQKSIEHHDGQTDILELRIDFLKDADKGKLAKILEQPWKSAICVTNRSEEEGGKFLGSEQERVSFLLAAAKAGADYIDIELASGATVIKQLLTVKSEKTKLIISYHNFDRTPEYHVLEKVMQRQADLGADICKIVTTATSPFDTITIFKLLEKAHEERRQLIALCMGEKGRLTRVVSPLLGGYLTFASMDMGKESAPGQMTLEQMRTIWKELGIEQKDK
ncbi:MAG: type I 3-dehydroquinate dehydratase [bacterium]